MKTASRRLRFHLLGVVLVTTFAIASAQPQPPLRSITYRLSMSRPASHLFEVAIEVELSENGTPASLDFQMAKWSPGRYAVFDFAKNVQEVYAASPICPGIETVKDGTRVACRPVPLPVARVDDQTWRIETKANTRFRLTYKVFGNDLSGTFSQLDAHHANFNGASVFMYVVNHKADPVKLVIDPPTGWRIVNSRMHRPDQQEWQFPNWDIMVDTPTEIAPNWRSDEFEVEGKKYYVVVHSFGDEAGKRAALVRDIERLVRAETAMWGPPEFESYTFLLHFGAEDRGDGMEHLTSTQIVFPANLAETGIFEDTLGTVAHEFFHVWNVKRLRPIEFGPWDFTRPANTRSLWIAEGLTNYYGHLMMRRAGIWDDSRFLRRESETINNIENAPGSKLMSAEEASLSAPFIDRAPHAQRTNLANTSVSYYPKGELLGLVLDLLIRGKTNGKASLDDVMRRMYDEFYLKSPNATYYLRGRGYETEDFWRVASEVARFDLSEFFKRYVRGVQTPPYDEVLNHVGLRLIREPADQTFDAGIVLADTAGVAKIQAVRNNSPAEDVGLRPDDIILKVGGRKVTSESWLSALNRYKSGDRVSISFQRNQSMLNATLTQGAPERFEYRIEERGDATAEQKALRVAWLKG